MSEGQKKVRGRHERAVEKSIRAFRNDGQFDDRDEAALTLLRAGARALDLGEETNQGYLPSKTINPLLDVLTEMRMTTVSRASAQHEAIEELLSELSKPAPPVRDSA